MCAKQGCKGAPEFWVIATLNHPTAMQEGSLFPKEPCSLNQSDVDAGTLTIALVKSIGLSQQEERVVTFAANTNLFSENCLKGSWSASVDALQLGACKGVVNARLPLRPLWQRFHECSSMTVTQRVGQETFVPSSHQHTAFISLFLPSKAVPGSVEGSWLGLVCRH